MKTTQFKPFRNLIAASVLAFSLVACDKDTFDTGNNDGIYTTTATASGNQTSPPTTTNGSATLIGEYNANTKNWEYRINWTNLSTVATGVQIHGPADAGVNGEMQFALGVTVPGVDGRAEGNLTLNAVQESYLLADKLYFTVLTTSNVNGEVRGQIFANEAN